MVFVGGSGPRSQLLRCPMQNFLCSWFSVFVRSTPVFFLGGGENQAGQTELRG